MLQLHFNLDLKYLDLILMCDLSVDGKWNSYGRDAARHVIEDNRKSIRYKRIHVSLVTFAGRDEAEIEFNLKRSESTSADEILATIDALSSKIRGSSVDFKSGFIKVSQVISQSARSNVKQMIVVITGASREQTDRDEAIRKSILLHNAGYHIYGIYAELRKNVRRVDWGFMEAVVNFESDGIKTSHELLESVPSYGYLCSQLKCHLKCKCFHLA